MTDFATAFASLLAATDDADTALTFVAAAKDIRERRETTERQVRALLERTVAASTTARTIHEAAEARHAELYNDPNTPTLTNAIGPTHDDMDATDEVPRPTHEQER